MFNISQFCDRGYDVMFDINNCTVINKNEKFIVFKGKRKKISIKSISLIWLFKGMHETNLQKLYRQLSLETISHLGKCMIWFTLKSFDFENCSHQERTGWIVYAHLLLDYCSHQIMLRCLHLEDISNIRIRDIGSNCNIFCYNIFE